MTVWWGVFHVRAALWVLVAAVSVAAKFWSAKISPFLLIPARMQSFRNQAKCAQGRPRGYSVVERTLSLPLATREPMGPATALSAVCERPLARA